MNLPDLKEARIRTNNKTVVKRNDYKVTTTVKEYLQEVSEKKDMPEINI